MKISIRKLCNYLACFIVLWLNAGVFDFVSGYFPTIVKFGIVAIWFLLIIRSKPGFLNKYVWMAWPILFTIAICYFSNLVGNGAYYNQYFMVFFYIAVIQAMFTYYYYWGEKKEIRNILVVFIVDIIIVSVRTFLEIMKNPIIVRAMSTSAALKERLLSGVIPLGVGAYAWCYQIAFLLICVAFYYGEYKRKAIIKYISFAATLILLFQAQITLALLLGIVFIFITSVFRHNTSRVGLFGKLAVLGIAIAVMINMNTLISLLANIANEDLANRLNEIMIVRNSSINEASDLSSRLRLYTESINSFLNNPIWGTFGAQPFGGHSTIFDLLATFGMMGIISIGGLIKPLRLSLKNSSSASPEHLYLVVTIIGYILLMTINVTVGGDLSLVFCLIIPLFFKYMADDVVE